MHPPSPISSAPRPISAQPLTRPPFLVPIAAHAQDNPRGEKPPRVLESPTLRASSYAKTELRLAAMADIHKTFFTFPRLGLILLGLCYETPRPPQEEEKVLVAMLEETAIYGIQITDRNIHRHRPCESGGVSSQE
ncbi:hypothetical protein EYR40_011123 [Pleurotus pulmonarius]|nr:hypothetical protein EYR40_011123 [Pleurotus pulmonarius]